MFGALSYAHVMAGQRARRCAYDDSSACVMDETGAVGAGRALGDGRPVGACDGRPGGAGRALGNGRPMGAARPAALQHSECAAMN